MSKDLKYNNDYCNFMNNMFDKGYAEKVPKDSLCMNDRNIWYIPHFGIYHPQKPDKIRVVFDCAAKFHGVSLNNILMQGPDLTNSIIDVLIRFRLRKYAYMADIESMFYQVHVPEKDRDVLRFLWWEDGKFENDPIEYRMTVHLFGACSSPSCATFALRRTISETDLKVCDESKDTILQNFYVDDCLRSMDDLNELINNANEVMTVCAEGGFNFD